YTNLLEQTYLQHLLLQVRRKINKQSQLRWIKIFVFPAYDLISMIGNKKQVLVYNQFIVAATRYRRLVETRHVNALIIKYDFHADFYYPSSPSLDQKNHRQVF